MSRDEHPLDLLRPVPRLAHGRWGMGWKPDRPDMNRYYGMPPVPPRLLPERTDLRQIYRFEVWDQGRIGSCTAQAILAALRFALATTTKAERRLPDWTGSRLQLYYNERWWEGTIYSDAGASLADGLKLLSWIGVAPDSEWPYDPERWAERPPATSYAQGYLHRVHSYHAVPHTPFAIQAHLAADVPVVFGASVYESFVSKEVARTGIVPMPESGERLEGGHAMLIVGYDMPSQTYIVRNSWSTDWGQGGYGVLPMEYIHSLDLTGSLWALEPSDL